MKNTFPLTIITINLNNKSGLQRTAESIISQSEFSKVEWIVVDGNSVDGSIEIISKYNKYITICIIEEDSGIYNAMNKGIRIAHGEYLFFLNSGDCLYNSRVLENFLSLKSFGRYDYYVGKMIFSDRENVKKILSPLNRVTLSSIMKGTIAHPASFIKHTRFKNMQYDENYRIVSDLKHFLIDLVFNCASYMPLDFVISVFDNSGISSLQIEKVNEERRRMFSECIPLPIMQDYIQFVYEKGYLHRFIRNVPINSIEYKFVGFIAALIYFPRFIVKRISTLFTK
mgnify:CR=1 FL=1